MVWARCVCVACECRCRLIWHCLHCIYAEPNCSAFFTLMFTGKHHSFWKLRKFNTKKCGGSSVCPVVIDVINFFINIHLGEVAKWDFFGSRYSKYSLNNKEHISEDYIKRARNFDVSSKGFLGNVLCHIKVAFSFYLFDFYCFQFVITWALMMLWDF